MDSSADGWPDGLPAQWRSAFRIELRAQAIGLALRGWPVVPGTVSASQNGAAATGHAGLSPVQADWQSKAGAHVDDVASWWSGDQPYCLLLATGSTVEAIEVDSELGRRTAQAIRESGFPVPIVATPAGRWFFLTSGSSTADRVALPAELAEVGDLRVHSTGSWVPLPPSTVPGGLVHWRVKPDVCSWQLPDAEFVHRALITGLGVDSPSALPTPGQLIG